MKTNPGGNDLPPTTTQRNAEAETDAALWAVLGRARQPAPPSPYFTRRVLREVALLDETKPAWQRWAGGLFASRRLGVTAGATCALLLTAVSTGLLPTHFKRDRHVRRLPEARLGATGAAAPAVPFSSAGATTADETPSENDIPVIADLDELLETEENRVWTDEDATAS